jgi:hypothetical protein
MPEIEVVMQCILLWLTVNENLRIKLLNYKYVGIGSQRFWLLSRALRPDILYGPRGTNRFNGKRLLPPPQNLTRTLGF